MSRSIAKIFLFFLFAFNATGAAQAGGLIVNELSNGPSGAKEFYELMVVGDAVSPTANINLNGWIIDDNNGDWGGSTTGVGIAAGYSRFDAVTNATLCSALASVSPGDIIVVYNHLIPIRTYPLTMSMMQMETVYTSFRPTVPA